MRKNKQEKKKLIGMLCLLFLLALGLGYAVLSQQLSINSTVDYDALKWDVGFTTATDGGGSVTAVPTLSQDKKSITVSCKVGASTSAETCIAKAKVKNGSSFTVELESDPTITYDNTYIDSVEATWSGSTRNVFAEDSIDVGETKEIQIKITTKELTKDMIPESSLSIPITITMNWVEDGDKSLKILSIGNSFAQDVMTYAYGISEELGYDDIKVAYLYYGAGTLNQHLTYAKEDSKSYTLYVNTNGTWEETSEYKFSTAVKSDDWDYITFQQASGSSGIANAYDDLNELIDIVKTMSPNSKLAWHMTWAYQGDSTHWEYPNYNNDQMTMYNAILDAVQQKIETNEKIDIILPVGTAIQNARTSYLGDTLTRDGYHLSSTGRFIAGVSYISALTGKSLDNFAYNILSEETTKLAIESSKNAALNPYSITPSQYGSTEPGGGTETPENPPTADPEDEPSGEYENYDRVILTLQKGKFYQSDITTVAIMPPNLVSSGAMANNFWATQSFTQETLPVGSIIEVAEGWMFRPDGWNVDAEGKTITTTNRPGNETTKVVIDEEWWSEFTYRGFNIAKNPMSDISSYTEEQINEIFKIYVPKTN